MASYGDDFKCKNFVCDEAHLRNTKSQNVTGITGTADPNAQDSSRPGKIGDLYFRTVAAGQSAIYVCTGISGTAPDLVYAWTKYGEANAPASGGA